MAEHLLHTVALPDDLLWTDEFSWVSVVRATEYSCTGALIVDTAQRLAGRPITLEGTDEHGWITRATLDAVRTLASSLPGAFVLALADGRSFNVTFAPEDPVQARQLYPLADPGPADWYVCTIKLIEI